MKLERIQTIQRLPIQVEEAWDFFTSPGNLSLITPPWLDYRLSSNPPEYMHPGTLYSAQIRPFPGISMQWITEITYIRPPSLFITDQRVGPFKVWHHEYHFREHADGVELEDIVQYGLPLGPIGSLVHDLYVRRKLHEVFTYRAQSLERRFGAVSRQKAAVQTQRHPSLQQQQPQRERPSQPTHPQPTQRKEQPGPAKAPPPKREQVQDTTQPPHTGKIITLEDIFGGTPDD